MISQHKTQESEEDLGIVRLSSIYQIVSYHTSFRGSREFTSLNLNISIVWISFCNPNFQSARLVIKLVDISVNLL